LLVGKCDIVKLFHVDHSSWQCEAELTQSGVRNGVLARFFALPGQSAYSEWCHKFFGPEEIGHILPQPKPNPGTNSHQIGWLRTPRLLIRPLCLQDTADWHRCRSAMPFDPQTRTLAESEALVLQMQQRPSLMAPGWQQFAVIDATGGFVGDFGIGFDEPGPGQSMLGFALIPERRGQGLAYEAGAALLEALFAQGLRRVAAITDIRNLAAQRLLLRLGFRQEALYRQSWWDGATWQDELGYARLAGD